MRLRKRHAWGAVLIVLFVLPVLKPGGVPALEDPAGGFFAWFAEVLPSPRLWTDDGEAEGDGVTDRERALEKELRQQMEESLRRGGSLEEIAERLIRAAEDGGGPDNITVLLGVFEHEHQASS